MPENKNKPCRFFMTSTCKKGDKCDFQHNKDFCRKYYVGKCKFGDKCKYSHDFQPNSLNKKVNGKHKKPKNTVDFAPDLTKPDMRIIVETVNNNNTDKFKTEMSETDVCLIPNFFTETDIYDKLLDEMKHTGFTDDRLWKRWHEGAHTIADDRLGPWKEKCPTLQMIFKKVANYFDMDVKATRFNWYKDNSDYKPLHHDAAALDTRKAKVQNLTVGINFGATRTARFQLDSNKTKIDFPLPNGSIYTFGKKVNIDWKHGILQEPELKEGGRISIILWGKNKQIIL